MRIELTLMDGRRTFFNVKRDLSFGDLSEYEKNSFPDANTKITLNEGTPVFVQETPEYIAKNMESLGIVIARKDQD